MSQTIHETTETRVKVTHAGRDGVTLALVRQFIREADQLGLPDSVPVRWEDKLAGEGANRSGYIEAVHRVTRNVPVALPAEEGR